MIASPPSGSPASGFPESGAREGMTASAPEPAPLLEADVRVQRGSWSLDVPLLVPAGQIVAVLGPNGAGKSTLLAVLAGTITPSAGHVRLDGRTLVEGSTWVPPERRRVGLLGQDPLLFPHLSALENVAFGPRAQGVPQSDARRIAADWLGRMGLAELTHRRPAQLSGGQQQRVALARALAARPDLLLLDEPLAALDTGAAQEMRQLLRTHLRESGATAILVTHDVLDAATVADSLLVLEDGAVADSGPVPQVLAAPRTAFSAQFAGLNLVVGTAVGDASTGEAAALQLPERALEASGYNTLTGSGRAPGEMTSADPDSVMASGLAAETLAAGRPASAVFPPHAVALHTAPVGGSPRNNWAGTVTAVDSSAATVHVRIDLDQADAAVRAELTVAAVAQLGLAVGMPVTASVKATEIRLYDRR